MTDPIADMLTRIRNATLVKHEAVIFLFQDQARDRVRILKEEGYIRDHYN